MTVVETLPLASAFTVLVVPLKSIVTASFGVKPSPMSEKDDPARPEVGLSVIVDVGVLVAAAGTIVKVVVAVMPLVTPEAVMVSGVSVLTLVDGTMSVWAKLPFVSAFADDVAPSKLMFTASEFQKPLPFNVNDDAGVPVATPGEIIAVSVAGAAVVMNVASLDEFMLLLASLETTA
jgi:hypothetical protein